MALRDCCQRPENLTITQRTADKIVRTCQVCGAKHIELTADPGHIGVKF